jgi:uncharacterized phage protein gp47/JayE
MAEFVTPTGFVKKTLPQIKAELEASFQAVFGNDIDLSADGSFGQIIGVLSQREADLWDGAEEIYTSRNVTQATGVSLDSIVAEIGVIRIDASPTVVENVIFYGDEGTAIAIGKKAKQANADLTYSVVDSAVTITKAAAREVQLEPNTTFPLTGGETFTVTIDATPYTYVGIAADTKAIVINALVSLITAGSWGGVASNVNDTYLKLLDKDLDFSVTWTSTFDLFLLGSGGDVEADEDGPNSLPANTLDTIATPISGWDSVNNPEAGTTGRDVETDDELRLRFASTFLAGNATDEAIRAKLLNNVDGVQTASVTSNRSLATDGEGRPPKSFEAVVQGGSDSDVAEEIWKTMPSGIESFGNTSEIIVDSEGRNQTIKFSRPTEIFIYVKVQRDFYNEEEYPTDGDNQIKQKIVEWALTEYTPGKDVIRGRLNIPIYEVPGIGELNVLIDWIPSPGGTPTYVEEDAPIASREIAVFDTSRIVVEAIP